MNSIILKVLRQLQIVWYVNKLIDHHNHSHILYLQAHDPRLINGTKITERFVHTT